MLLSHSNHSVLSTQHLRLPVFIQHVTRTMGLNTSSARHARSNIINQAHTQPDSTFVPLECRFITYRTTAHSQSERFHPDSTDVSNHTNDQPLTKSLQDMFPPVHVHTPSLVGRNTCIRKEGGGSGVRSVCECAHDHFMYRIVGRESSPTG